MSMLLHSATARRVLSAPRARVFSAFTTAKAMQTWFSPSPDISLKALQFEFFEGGRYRFQYAMPDGSHPVLGGQFLHICPPESLVFTWVWEAPDTHAKIPTQVTIELRDQGERTEITILHAQIPNEDMARRHATGWEATLDHFETVLVRPGAHNDGSN